MYTPGSGKLLAGGLAAMYGAPILSAFAGTTFGSVALPVTGLGLDAYAVSTWTPQLGELPPIFGMYSAGSNIAGRIEGGVANSTSRLTPRVDVTENFSSRAFSDGSRQYTYLNPEGIHGLVMDIDRNGVLGLNIRAQGDVATLGSGRDMFISGMQRLSADGMEVKAIRGYWMEGTDSINVQQYLKNLQTMSAQEAAANTWTGRIARDYGYVNVGQPTTSFGNTTVLFTK